MKALWILVAIKNLPSCNLFNEDIALKYHFHFKAHRISRKNNFLHFGDILDRQSPMRCDKTEYALLPPWNSCSRKFVDDSVVFIVQTYLRSSFYKKMILVLLANTIHTLRINTISKANTTSLVLLFIDRIIIVFMRLPLLYCVTLTTIFTPTISYIFPCFIIKPYINAVSCLVEYWAWKQVITSEKRILIEN